MIRVAFFPPPRRPDPRGFLALLRDATVQRGAHWVDTHGLRIRWSLRGREVDVVHLHWLEYLATSDPRPVLGWARTWLRIARLLTCLAILRARRVAIVWTVHNLSPHEAARPRAEAALARGVYLLTDELIVHSAYAAERVRMAFPGPRRPPVTVIPHPNYIGVFAEDPRERRVIRDALGVPEDAFVYLAFGIIRDYKQLGRLSEQFRGLPGDHLRLLIAGAPSQARAVEAVQAQAALDPRIMLRAEYVPDERVAGLHRAADAAVLAYEDVFSSGALLLALSYGLPVVTPAGGTAGELFDAPAVEFVQDGDLAGALERVRTGERSGAALRAAERFPWSRAGAATVEVYRRAIARRTTR